jgi:glycosyltransferase involved in cell wall biosynthesis
VIPAAFYAPLKPPTHPTPSGDRSMARALQTALEMAGFASDLASNLRSRDGKGDAQMQANLEAEAAAHVPSLIETGRMRGWRLWLTYHNYYKAPDLLGPPVAEALGIPYAQVESTRAHKRFGGPWDRFARRAEAAADAASVIFHLTERDAGALHKFRYGEQRIVHLPPFLPRTDLPPAGRRTGDILVAGMMRAGDKLESYRLVAQALALLPGDWGVEIAGDGPMRDEVETLMGPFAPRVQSLGRLDSAGMDAAYDRAKVLFWPGVNEAFGLVYLEAQAAGVPVVAQDRPGLRDVLPPGFRFPQPDEGAAGLADALATMRETPPPPETLQRRIAAHHLLPAAAARLRSALEPLL